MIKYIADEAPYYLDFQDDINWSELPYRTSKKEKDTYLNKLRFQKEEDTKILLEKTIENFGGISHERIDEITQNITILQKNNLAHYVLIRKMTLDLLKKFIEK